MALTQPVYALGYIVRRGLRGMVRTPLIHTLATGTMAVCILLLGTIVLVWGNAQAVTEAWGLNVPVTAYLVDKPNGAHTDQIVAQLNELPQVERVEHVTPEQAMQRLVEGLGDDPTLLSGLHANVLPESLEIHLGPQAPATMASALAERLKPLPSIEDVAVAGPWVPQVVDMLATLQRLALGAAIVVGLACMTVVWTTIRLGVYARRAEIQILRLVGGTGAFVRGPFIVQGMLQGLVGATAAIALLRLSFESLRPFVEQGMSLLFAAGSLRFLSPPEIVGTVVFGAVIGIVGSRAAVTHYVET